MSPNSPGAHLERSSIPPRGAQRVCELAAVPYFPDINCPGHEDSTSSFRSCCYLHLRVAHCSRLGSSFRRFLARKPQLRRKAGTPTPSFLLLQLLLLLLLLRLLLQLPSSHRGLRPRVSVCSQTQQASHFLFRTFSAPMTNICPQCQFGSSCRMAIT